METVFWEACDNCHHRKTRCPLNGTGACENCRRTGQACVFSPRNTMGRPRHEKIQRRSSTRNRCGDIPGADATETWGHVPPALLADASSLTLTNGTHLVISTAAGNTTNDSSKQHEDVFVTTEETRNLANETSYFAGTWGGNVSSLNSEPIPWITVNPGPIHDNTDQEPQPPSTDPIELGPRFSSSHHQETAEDRFLHEPNDAINRGLSKRAGQNLLNNHHEAAEKVRYPQKTGVEQIVVLPPVEGVKQQECAQGSLHLYAELSHLFALQAKREIGGRYFETEKRKEFEGFLASVSSLCDVVVGLLSSHWSAPRDGSSSPCLLLAASVITIVVDVHQQTTDMLRTVVQSRHWLSPAQSTHESLLGATDTAEMHWQGTTQGRLQILSDAMSMDFYLTQLKRVYGPMEGNAGGSSGTPQRLDGICATLQSLIHDLRAT